MCEKSADKAGLASGGSQTRFGKWHKRLGLDCWAGITHYKSVQALIGSVVLGDFHLSIRGSTVIRMFFLHTYILYIDMFDCTKKSKQLQTDGLNKTNNTTSLHIYEINIFPNLFSMSLNIFLPQMWQKYLFFAPWSLQKWALYLFAQKSWKNSHIFQFCQGFCEGFMVILLFWTLIR